MSLSPFCGLDEIPVPVSVPDPFRMQRRKGAEERRRPSTRLFFGFLFSSAPLPLRPSAPHRARKWRRRRVLSFCSQPHFHGRHIPPLKCEGRARHIIFGWKTRRQLAALTGKDRDVVVVPQNRQDRAALGIDDLELDEEGDGVGGVRKQHRDLCPIFTRRHADRRLEHDLGEIIQGRKVGKPLCRCDEPLVVLVVQHVGPCRQPVEVPRQLGPRSVRQLQIQEVHRGG